MSTATFKKVRIASILVGSVTLLGLGVMAAPDEPEDNFEKFVTKPLSIEFVGSAVYSPDRQEMRFEHKELTVPSVQSIQADKLVVAPSSEGLSIIGLASATFDEKNGSLELFQKDAGERVADTCELIATINSDGSITLTCEGSCPIPIACLGCTVISMQASDPGRGGGTGPVFKKIRTECNCGGCP